MKSALVCKREVLSVPTSPEGFRKRVLGCAAEKLGWQPGKGLQEGLKTTYCWIVEQVKTKDGAGEPWIANLEWPMGETCAALLRESN